MSSEGTFDDDDPFGSFGRPEGQPLLMAEHARPKPLTMLSLTHSPRRLLAALLVGVLAATPVNLAAAEPTETTATEHEELAELVALVLAELGLAADPAAPMDDLIAGVADRVAALVDEGLVDPEGVDALGELIEAGSFDEIVATVEAARERRDAFREATEAVLEELGIDVPEDGTLQDAIDASGLTREQLADLVEESGVELPGPPSHAPCDGDRGAGCDEQPAERAPAPAPTTTRPPAPVTEPEPEPTPEPPPPPPAYPEASPAPGPDYPTSGGAGSDSAPTPKPEYPTAGSESPDPETEVSL